MNLRLRHRLLQAGDFEEALELLPRWMGLPDAVRLELPRLWQALLHQPGFNADVIEDVSLPPGERLLALGVSVVVDDRWRRMLADAPPAYAARHLYGDMLAGRFALPSDAAIARANADDGVDFLVLHWGQRHRGVEDPDALALWSLGLNAMRAAHAGHRVRRLYQEAFGDECHVMRSIGLQQRTQRAATPGAAPLPELFGLSRDEALRMLPGSHLRDVFDHRVPLFGFSPAERRLLRRALFDESDDEIARHFSTTPDTLKKQWRSVYARATQALPDFFGDAAQAADDGGRGPEKKRRIVNYLRQHPEELRPYAG